MVVEGGTPYIERGIRQEDIVITAQSLYRDNHSPAAETARLEFEEKEVKGQLNAVEGCSDARTWTSGHISIRNIAGASLPRPELAAHRSIQLWNADSHYDSDKFDPGQAPTGCGGLGAKEKLGDTVVEKPGVLRYASSQIGHPDPILQAIMTAEGIAALSGGKPVLATAQDHLTQKITPVAFFQMVDGEEISRKAVQRKFLSPKNYDPERIYAEGMPSLNEEHLPDTIRELLEKNRREARELQARYPNSRELLGTQRPRMVLLTTDRRSARGKFPTISSAPGSLFKINLTREKEGDSINITQGDLELALDQLSYPIQHAVQNSADQSMPFSNTDRLIVETGDLKLSRKIVQAAIREEWMKEWHRLPGRSIILLQTNDGIVNDLDELPVAA